MKVVNKSNINKKMSYHDLSHFIPPSVFAAEAQAFGTMLVAYGYVYPLQNHKKLVMCNDATLYRFQVKLKLSDIWRRL